MPPGSELHGDLSATIHYLTDQSCILLLRISHFNLVHPINRSPFSNLRAHRILSNPPDNDSGKCSTTISTQMLTLLSSYFACRVFWWTIP